MKTLHIITGQTATGKTAAALELATHENGELINFDSRQIYKHLDIVTGKDFQEKNFLSVQKNDLGDCGYYTLHNSNKDIKIWLYDIITPAKPFSAFDFEQLCIPLIQDIWSRGKVPVLVGGTYLYIYFLLYSNSEPKKPDWEFRRKMESKTVEELQQLAKEKDNDVFLLMNSSDRNNPHRLIRFLEKSDVAASMSFELKIAEKLGISRDLLDVSFQGFKHKDKTRIKDTIKNRVQNRLEQGAVDEVTQLVEMGYSENDPGLQSIGCRQILSYTKKDMSYNEMLEEWVNKEYQYAKRQLTFMSRDPHIKWRDI